MKQERSKALLFFFDQLEKLDCVIMHEIKLCRKTSHEKIDDLVKERGKIINIISSISKKTKNYQSKDYSLRVNNIIENNNKIEAFLAKEKSLSGRQINEVKKLKKINKAYSLNSVEHLGQNEP